MAKPDDVANDNRPALARHVPIVGVVGDLGQVTITDPAWRAAWARPASEPIAFPSDPREA